MVGGSGAVGVVVDGAGVVVSLDAGGSAGGTAGPVRPKT
jgi:hypothetical protein